MNFLKLSDPDPNDPTINPYSQIEPQLLNPDDDDDYEYKDDEDDDNEEEED